MEIEKLRSETAENYAEAGLDQAKARQTNSDADKTDLDFVEQESGVTQEREKELQGEQARGNIQLERVKQGLKQAADRETELSKFLGLKNVG